MKANKQKPNSYALASFISSLFFWVPLLNILSGALAISFGIAGLNEIKSSKNKSGKTFAIIGISLGAITLILYITGNIYLLITKNI